MIAQQPQTDLTNCDREPIHIPGRVQSHGVLFVLALDTLTIEQVSENTEEFLGKPPAMLLGKPLSEALGEAAVKITSLEYALLTNGVHSLSVNVSGEIYQAVISINPQNRVILELEPDIAASNQEAYQLYDLIQQSINRLENVNGMDELFAQTAHLVRSFTGFDRVKIYRFDANWNGSVVAEAKVEAMPSYLGLHFPATDIPKQARALYVRNRIRLIVDVAGEPVGLVRNADDTEPLDMSDMALRAVSPIHIEYLRNMQVGASMSISILKNGELWGLIACHHRTKFHVPYRIRTICKLLSLTLSTQLIAREQQSLSATYTHARDTQDEIFQALLHTQEPFHALIAKMDSLLQLTNATGAVIWLDGEIETRGVTPDYIQVEDLIAWLDTLDSDWFATNSLMQQHSAAEEYAVIGSGLLAIRISQKLDQHILWFRPEQVETVAWGGNPEKSITVDADGSERISPRKSFEKWSQEVRNTARAWQQHEIDAALTLRSNIVDVILRRMNELRQMNLRLERSNIELDAFAYIASHDLKEPLRGIHNYSSILLRRYAEELGEDGHKKLNSMVRLTQRLDALLDSLLHYSRVGRLELNLETVDLNEVTASVIDSLHARITEEGAKIGIPRPLPTISCDGIQIAEVFSNLVSNGLKYNDKEHKSIEIGYLDAEDDTIIFYVKDNGIGIPEKHHQNVFRIFKRLHKRDQYGGGTGAGLTIAQKIIQRHNGTLWLQSEVGVGTTFFFSLNPKLERDNV